jgi:HPt (histidine-containing phosphotransfer) domain-containing protein
MSRTNDPIDYHSALERTGGDEDFLKELIAIYIEEYTHNMKELEDACEQNDFPKIREIGHSLKGSSGNLSLPQLQEISFRIEKAGESKDASQIKRLLCDLDKEFNRLKEFLS